jgi:hypothetical protein
MLAKFTSIMLLVLLSPMHNLLAETSDADVVFHIECPPDVTVDCDAEIWDLSGYGWAYIHGYGSPIPAGDPVVSYHLNSCGTGHVTRTWTAYDYQNNAYSCTQYIYVGAGGGFNASNIHWPPNYMTPDCNASLEPDDLPAPFDYPTYDDVECSMIMIGYDDLVFDFGGGCKKILRTWSLLNWCEYNPNYPYGGGRWDHTQVLKIKPNGDILLDCPDDVMASAGPNCSGTYVSIPPATGTGACGGSVQVTNNSPYASSHGADASGNYPYGTTWVTFTAEDACGNWESCKIQVVVKDMKKPTPICYNGLTANLMMNQDGYYIDLVAEWFNKGSFDNCTPKHSLRYRIEPSRFTCDQLGRQDVKMYVKDLDGNEQYCNTYVIIQDNMGMCPPPDTTTFSLSGTLTNIQGLAMADVELELMENADIIDAQLSDATGSFLFPAVMNSADYMVMPRGNEEYTLGLSTFDLLKLAKHINGVKLLASEGELIAADADQNGEVDVMDLLVLRKLLLHYTTKLPQNKAWRFIPTELLESGQHVSDMNVEEYWRVEELYDDYDNIDFTVIKIGDINGSVHNLTASTRRSQPLEMTWNVVRDGNKLDFVSTQSLEVGGFQMQLDLESSITVDILPGVLNISMSNGRTLDHELLLSFIEADHPISVSKGDVLFSLVFEEGMPERGIKLLESKLLPELYSENELIYLIYLNHVNTELPVVDVLADVDRNVTGIKLFPNPAKKGNAVQIVCAEQQIEEVIVYDSRGQVQIVQANIGSNEVNVKTTGLSSGLYMISVKMADGQLQYDKIILE